MISPIVDTKRDVRPPHDVAVDVAKPLRRAYDAARELDEIDGRAVSGDRSRQR